MSVQIKDLSELSEYDACVELQLEVWGFPEIDVVPAGHLVAMHHYGGVCVGAFEGSSMVGFVCGFAGWDGTGPYHHSHMLAVRPEYRGRGLGESLKWAQRDRVLEQGIELMNWTFDPLQAPNANLNLNRLGAFARRYKVNLYGESTSRLHGGIPTDRFEAEWRLKSQRVSNVLSGEGNEFPGWEELPRANRTRDENGLIACEPDLELGLEAEHFLVEVPPRITELMERAPELALDWRFRSRALFQEYFQRGYRVEGLHRADGRTFYRLAREPGASE